MGLIPNQNTTGDRTDGGTFTQPPYPPAKSATDSGYIPPYTPPIKLVDIMRLLQSIDYKMSSLLDGKGMLCIICYNKVEVMHDGTSWCKRCHRAFTDIDTFPGKTTEYELIKEYRR